MSTHSILFLEPRRLHALGAQLPYRSEALAAFPLARTPFACELIARMGWRHLEEVVIGDAAVELARSVPGANAHYPMLAARDEREWRVIRALIDDRLDGSELLLLLPTKDTGGRRLGLRSIPEFLLLGKSGELRMESVTAPLVESAQDAETLRFGWVFEESGISVAARWKNELGEDHLDSEIIARSEVVLHHGVEQALGRSLALHRHAWRAGTSPRLAIRAAIEAEHVPLLASVLPRVLRRFQIDEVDLEILAIEQLLERARGGALRRVDPAPVPSFTRPQAIRPRSVRL